MNILTNNSGLNKTSKAVTTYEVETVNCGVVIRTQCKDYSEALAIACTEFSTELPRIITTTKIAITEIYSESINPKEY